MQTHLWRPHTAQRHDLQQQYPSTAPGRSPTITSDEASVMITDKAKANTSNTIASSSITIPTTHTHTNITGTVIPSDPVSMQLPGLFRHEAATSSTQSKDPPAIDSMPFAGFLPGLALAAVERGPKTM
jgi:hypothetical protein